MSFIWEALGLHPATLLVVIIGLLILLSKFSGRRNLPPQPGLALPVIGHLHKLSSDPRVQFRQWRKQYGDVFSYYLGTQLVVVLSGYDILKATLVKRADEFSHRSPMFFDQVSGIEKRGLISANGPDWREQRAFVLSELKKQHGMGTSRMADLVCKEGTYLLESLRETGGSATNIIPEIYAASSNLTFRILFGVRLEYDDPTFRNLTRMAKEFFGLVSNTSILNVFPILWQLPGDPFHGNNLRRTTQALVEALWVTWDQLQKERGPINKEDSLMAAYIDEMKKKRESGVATYMDEPSLKRITFDLFVTGSETTPTSFEWCFLFLLHNPKVQEKLLKEIDREIGRERLPTTHDRSKLVYLNAVIMETQRLGDIAPLNSHMNPVDLHLNGYVIPKGATIFPDLGSVLEDTTIWGPDADSFRPERFLDSEGRLIHREELIPFSLGRRACIGEPLASMELFFVLAMVLQKFRFEPEDPDNLPPTDQFYEGGVVRPKSYRIRVVPRD